MIVSVFPTETAGTYFTPAQYGRPSKGKLWNAHNSLRSTLASVGVIERRPKKCKPLEDSSN